MKFPNFIYSILLGEAIPIGCFNYPFDKNYDENLSQCIKTGLSSYSLDHHYAEVIFNNSICYRFWNSNEYYAWLNVGRFHNMNYELNTQLVTSFPNILSYNEKRPSARTMYKFLKLLKNFKGLQQIRNLHMSIIQEEFNRPLKTIIPSQQDIINNLIDNVHNAVTTPIQFDLIDNNTLDTPSVALGGEKVEYASSVIVKLSKKRNLQKRISRMEYISKD